MAENIVQKVLIDLEVKKAKEEMRELAKNSGDAKTAVAALNARAKELENSLDSVKRASGTLNPEFKSLGRLAIAFNQGLELANKALHFAEEGLEAYAKTSEEARGEVFLLTSEFAKWKREVMESAGEMTVALAKSLPSLDRMREWAERMDRTGQSLHDVAVDIQKELGGTASIFEAAFGSVGEIQKLGSTIDFFLGRVTNGWDEAAARAKKAAKEYEKWVKEMGALGDKMLGTPWSKGLGLSVDEIQGMSESPAARAIRRAAADRAAFDADVQRDTDRLLLEEAPDKQRAPDFGAAMQSLSESGSAVAELQQALADVQNAKNKTLFEAAFGPISEIDSYAESIMALGAISQSFSTAWQQSLQAIGEGSMSAGGIFKKGLGTMAAGIGQYLAAQSGRHAVEAAAHAVLLDFPGAARHAGAAVIYGGGAVAAYAVASKLGAGSGSVSTPKGGAGTNGRDHRGSDDDGRGNGGTVSTDRKRGDGGRSVIIVYADPFADQSARERALTAEKTWKRVSGGSGSEDS